jgi:hypothetical protein
MPITGRPKKHTLIVTAGERAELLRLTKGDANRALAFRARLVLACADNLADTAVARRYRTRNATVGKWRTRFIARRLEGLYDAPRVGAPRTVSYEAVEAVIVNTLKTIPVGATRWSTRTMAKKAGISHTLVGRIWRAVGLKPHLPHSLGHHLGLYRGAQRPDASLLDQEAQQYPRQDA